MGEKLYEVVVSRSETYKYTVLAETEAEAIRKYKDDDYIDGQSEGDYDSEVLYVEEAN